MRHILPLKLYVSTPAPSTFTGMMPVVGGVIEFDKGYLRALIVLDTHMPPAIELMEWRIGDRWFIYNPSGRGIYIQLPCRD